MTSCVKNIKRQDRFMLLRFEDLVTDYDNTVSAIEQFLGLSDKKHTRRFDFFDPKVSIKNVSLWKTLPNDHKAAIDEIARTLPQYCFDA